MIILFFDITDAVFFICDGILMINLIEKCINGAILPEFFYLIGN